MKLQIIAFFLALSACADQHGSERIFVSQDDRESFAAHHQLAQHYYDRAEFALAAEHGREALALAGEHPEARHTLALIYLAQAGFAFINSVDTILNKPLSTTTSNDPFSTLAVLLELVPDDIGVLGTRDGLDTAPVSSEYFAGIPLYLPHLPGDHVTASSPRYEITALRNINEAIALLCPLIPAGVVEEEDRRSHLRYQCTPYAGTIASPSQHLLAFILAHLIEAIHFNALLLYSDNPTHQGSLVSKNNLIARSNALEKSLTRGEALDATAVSRYATTVTGLLSSFSAIFDLTTGSMLSELLVDISVITNSLQSLSMLPKSFTEKIAAFHTAILRRARQSSDSEFSHKALLQALSEKLADAAFSRLGTHIDSYFDQLDRLLEDVGGITSRSAELHELCQEIASFSAQNSALPVPSHCDEVLALTGD